MLPTRIKPPGTTRETASRREKTAEAPTTGRRGLAEKRRSGGEEGNLFPTVGKSKALKG